MAMAHNLMVCLVFFFVIFHMTPVSRGCLAGGFSMDNPHTNQRSGDDMVYEAYRYELTIEETLDIKSFFFPKNGVEYIYIYFLNQMISP